ncbi:MAG: hypothetical protein BRC22_00410 [Parcubacteria group bacterium QH_9_35_7]|nr:MAG: hypothetical protein BRC22_00410 [Parcubacteria group bacterium QH_9_35_7]
MTNTKQNIIQTAEKLFAQQGFESTSMRQIAQEVNMSKANLYHHFSSKRDLLSEIIETAFETYKYEIENIVDKNKKPKQRLKSAIVSYFDFCEEKKNLVQLLAREDIKRNREVKELVMEIEHKVRELWKSLLDELDLSSECDLNIITDLFMSMVDSIVIKKFVLECKKVEADSDKIADHILYLLD